MRIALYGTLLTALALTGRWHVQSSDGQAWQRIVAHWTDAPPPEVAEAQRLRPVRLNVLQLYLHSCPTPPAPAVIADLESLPDSVLASLMEWMPQKPLPRCLTLTETTGLTAENPCYPGLLQAALLGHKAPALEDSLPLLVNLGLPTDGADYLHLLNLCAVRADSTGQPAIATDLLCRIARHPLAGMAQVRTMVRHARAIKKPNLALETLLDWRDDPPDSASSAEVNEVNLNIAQLALATGNASLLREEIARAQFRLDHDALNIDSPEGEKWTQIVSSAAPHLQNWSTCISWLEQRLRLDPHHRLNWRELAGQPPASPDYCERLRHLADACLAARMESRAFELLLHLAWLEDPTVLAQAIPIGQRLDRLDECEQLLLRTTQRTDIPITSRPALVQRIAHTCIRDGESPSAIALLSWHLHDVPTDSVSSRLLLELQTHDLPPFRAAMIWRQHLQKHPGDTAALHTLVSRWIEAGQSHAALKELTTATQLTPALRLKAFTLALELRDRSSFQTALERLLASQDLLSLPQCLEAITFAENSADTTLRSRFIAHARHLHPTAPSLRQFASAQASH